MGIANGQSWERLIDRPIHPNGWAELHTERQSCPRPIDRSRAIGVIPAAELAERAASNQPIQEIVNQLSSGVGEPNDLPSNSLKGDCRSTKLWSWRTE
ncbi:uncharacterized protein G2W53_041812 [Senna tora]|uniref:Uncharacterized protein n=1 Tax=Senna tora TaxID=362788 RepID=A0A834W1S9_9FABA|nr:uncharacterized protein G2W53_041812 [Senna tora]